MFASSTRRVRQSVVVESMDHRRYCDSDNSLGSAADLGTVSAYYAKTGNLTSKTDTKDFYKFVVPAGSKTFGVKVGSLGKNADLYLYNGSKTQIASSKNDGMYSEVLVKSLTPGTYYAEVRAKDTNSATTSYNLQLMSDAAGNDKAAARDVGAINNSGSAKYFSDYAGNLDLNDYYKFTSVGGKLTVNLGGLSGDVDMALIDSNGATVATSTLSGTSSEVIVKDVSAGTYYVRVYPYGSSTDTKYDLSIKSVTNDTGNTVATAKTVTSPYTGSETVGAGDTYDFYKITVPDYSYLIMTLKVTDKPAVLAFHDANGAIFDTAAAIVGNDGEMTYFLHGGGVRYVSVINGSSTLSHYTIGIKTQAF